LVPKLPTGASAFLSLALTRWWRLSSPKPVRLLSLHRAPGRPDTKLDHLIVLLGVALASPASAQPAPLGSPVETVIVTAPKWLGDKPQTVIHNFVHSYAMAATPTIAEVTRWKFGICTRTYGLSQPEYNQFVTQRVEDIAVEAGVKVMPTACRLNVEIVFTAKPQEFLDRVHAEGARLLGPRPSQADTTSKMRYAIQAWYATATRGLDGILQGDNEDNACFCMQAMTVGQGNFGQYSSTPFYSVEGTRLREGLNSELAHIYVIADTSKTEGYELGAVADYVAMLALSQTQSFDSCKPIPSITNLIAPSCDADLKPKAITDTDLAYLKAVYSMDPGANFQQQQNYIAAEIGNSLGLKR